MTDEAFEDLGRGVRKLRAEVNAWALSPDDLWLAVCSAGALRVVECETGREVMTVQGRGASGVEWLSNDLVLVLRPQDFGVRAVVHAVPDGGVLSSVALVGMNRSTSAISRAMGGGGDDLPRAVLITPERWHGGPRDKTRGGLGYVLVPPSWEVAAQVDPDGLTVLPRLPFARPCVGEMHPDGDKLALWLGEPGPQGVSRADRGTVVLYDWRTKRAVKTARAASDAVEMLWCDPTRIALRGAGEMAVVDTALGERVYDSVEDQSADAEGLRGFAGTTETMDLHPDGERLLVAGRRTEEGKKLFTGVLGVVDVGSGSRGELRGFAARPAVALGAQWTGEGDEVLVLGSRVAARTRVERWSTPRAGPMRHARSWEFAVPSKPRIPAELKRSPTGRWTVVQWVEALTRAQRGDDGPRERGTLLLLDTD